MSVHDAATLAKALNGKKSGSGWVACCPAHDDRNPSLSISCKGGKVLVHCLAGCPQSVVIAPLRALGVWSGGASDFTVDPAERARLERERKEAEAKRVEAARKIWRSCGPITGSPAENYLASRGITLPLPRSLRFNPSLRHPTGEVLPCMVAAVVDVGGNLTGVHRTYLSADGGKAKVEPVKAMLGPCSGGAVRLGNWHEGETLLLSEGLETGLSGMQLSGNPGWACLSTSGLRSVVLPNEIRNLTILVDADEPGERAAKALAARLTGEGRSVRLARPPTGYPDWNDYVIGRAAA